MPPRSRRGRTVSLLLAGLALAVSMTDTPPAGAAPAAADPVVGEISTEVTPRISLGGAPVVVSGTVTGANLPATGLAVVVRRAGTTTLPDRAGVAAWAGGTSPATGAVLGSGVATRTPGGAAFRVTVPMSGLGAGQPYGALPISITVGSRTVHSFLPFHRRKEYEPLRLAFAVPVVGTTDRRKYGTVEERVAAWTAEAEPTGRLRALLEAVRGVPATLLLDPDLLDPGAVAEPAAPTATASPTTPNAATDDASYAASAEEVAARTRLAEAVRSASTAAGSVLRLPASDPDLAAATAGDGARTLVEERVRAESADRTVLWPAGGAWSTAIERTVDALDPRHTGLAVADSAWLTATQGRSTEALHRTRGGTTLAVADHALSARLGALTDSGGVEAFLADTLALLAERPGTTRSFLVTLPRTVAANPSWVQAVTTTLASPWVEGIDLPTLAELTPGAPVTPAASHPTVPAAPLAQHGGGLDADARELAAAATVRSDASSYLARWAETTRALTATGWRGDPAGWSALAAAVRTESRRVATELTVPPRDINFLADSGRVRIVVVNGLDVPVRGLRLRLVPESPRLRIDSAPIELSIGAGSRTTVTVAATALAAGEVPVRAVLLTPSGEELSSSTNIRIRVTPTGAAVYWVIGGIAALVLVLGVLRSRRRRRAGPAPAGTLPA